VTARQDQLLHDTSRTAIPWSHDLDRLAIRDLTNRTQHGTIRHVIDNIKRWGGGVKVPMPPVHTPLVPVPLASMPMVPVSAVPMSAALRQGVPDQGVPDQGAPYHVDPRSTMRNGT
jgi:hypothetical protein